MISFSPTTLTSNHRRLREQLGGSLSFILGLPYLAVAWTNGWEIASVLKGQGEKNPILSLMGHEAKFIRKKGNLIDL